MIKTVYEFEIYSSKGVETVIAESSYKPLWQVRDEVEQAYKTKNNINSSVIVCLKKRNTLLWVVLKDFANKNKNGGILI